MLDSLSAIKPIAEFLLKVVNLIDPDKRSEVNRRRALNFAEKYIFLTEEIARIKQVNPFTEKEERKVGTLERKRAWYRKVFFEYS